MIEKILGELFEKIEQDINGEKTEKIDVGRITGESLYLHHELSEMKEELEDEVEDRKQELMIQIKRQLKQEFKEKERAITALHRKAWEKTYNEFDLNPNGNYSVNAKTGVVKQKVKIKDPFKTDRTH